MKSNNSSVIYAQISIGVLFDKITILKIKQNKMTVIAPQKPEVLKII